MSTNRVHERSRPKPPDLFTKQEDGTVTASAIVDIVSIGPDNQPPPDMPAIRAVVRCV